MLNEAKKSQPITKELLDKCGSNAFKMAKILMCQLKCWAAFDEGYQRLGLNADETDDTLHDETIRAQLGLFPKSREKKPDNFQEILQIFLSKQPKENEKVNIAQPVEHQTKQFLSKSLCIPPDQNLYTDYHNRSLPARLNHN